MDHKKRALDLAKIVREARMQDPVARYAIELVKVTLDDLKDKLVDAEGEDMLRLQGAVRHFRKLHNELTNDPPHIIKSKENS